MAYKLNMTGNQIENKLSSINNLVYLSSNTLAFKGKAPIETSNDDTVTFWSNIATGIYWFSGTGKLIGVDYAYGYLIHIRYSSEIRQIYFGAPKGKIYSRGASFVGWDGAGSPTDNGNDKWTVLHNL